MSKVTPLVESGVFRSVPILYLQLYFYNDKPTSLFYASFSVTCTSEAAASERGRMLQWKGFTFLQ
jgi:hypothetical protein